MYPFLGQHAKKQRQSTVDALERNPSGRRTIIRNDFTSRSVRATQGGAAVVQPQPSNRVVSTSAKPTTKRSTKGRIKSSTVAIYTSVFALLVAVIAVGYRAPQETQSAAATAPVANVVSDTADQPAVSDVVATDIAATVADAAGLVVAPNISELAISTRAQDQYANATDSSSISKPVIVQLSAASRNIMTYEVESGDTVASIAKQFGISETTLRWANNLQAGDTVEVGSSLSILPVDGITYTVKDGDTLTKIASRYKANKSVIVTYNDLELNGISKGLKIIIPDGVLPTEERPGYSAPQVNYGGIFRAGSVGNRYAYGNCTWYAYERRAAIGKPVGSFWGNAKTWDDAARSQGYSVNNRPQVGDVMVEEFGYYGHVAFVKEVKANGDVVLSEMNNYAYGGFNIITERTLTAGQAALYQFIH